MPRKRIDWTEYEQATMYSAIVELLKSRKIETPISTAKGRTAFLNVARDAQVALPENRRRKHLNSLDNITGALRQRFIDNGILPRNLEALKKGAKVKAPDPREEKIAELTQQLEQVREEWANQLEQAKQQCTQLQTINNDLRERITVLENQPTPMMMLQEAIADTLALAMRKANDVNKPAFFRPGGGSVAPKSAGIRRDDDPTHDEAAFVERRKENLPVFERERRKDPSPTSSAGEKLPKVVIVANGRAVQSTAEPAIKGLVHQARFTIVSGDNIHALKDKVRNADMTFVLIGSVSHATTNSVTQATRHFERVHNWGADNLRSRIKVWLEREWDTAKV